MTLPTEITPDLPDELAKDWFGLGTWAIIVTGLVTIAVLCWKVWLEVKKTNNQVVNGHAGKPVLRADIDGITATVQSIHELVADHGDRLNSIEQHLRNR